MSILGTTFGTDLVELCVAVSLVVTLGTGLGNLVVVVDFVVIDFVVVFVVVVVVVGTVAGATGLVAFVDGLVDDEVVVVFCVVVDDGFCVAGLVGVLDEVGVDTVLDDDGVVFTVDDAVVDEGFSFPIETSLMLTANSWKFE